MTYFGELRANARALAAASLGVGMGVYLLSYVSSIFSPYLVKQFGWTREQYALLGLASLAVLVATPFIGRATDRFGPHRVALIGVIGIPAVLVACSQMNGDFGIYVALMTLILTLGMAASPVVYTRVVAERMVRARGFALTIIMSTPALIGALGAPQLNGFIAAHGWRAGYLLIAAVIAVGGGLALLLLPRSPVEMPRAARLPRAVIGYGQIFRNRAFWLILVALVLCTLPTTIHTSQMNLMLIGNGLTTATAAVMISVFAIGTLIGRLLCGLALDRFPPHLVAGFSMGLPAIGLALLSSSWHAQPVIAVSMFLVGLAYGAEGDVVAFLIARWFRVEIYSSVLGLMFAGTGTATALGSAILSATLRQTNSYALFLGLAAAAVLAGGILFLLLGRLAPPPPLELPEPA